MVILVNLGVGSIIVFMTESRLTEIEQRIEQRVTASTEERWQRWRGELTTARSGLGVEVAGLRSELMELRQAMNADDGDLRSRLDALGGRLQRMERMVTILWRTPSNEPQAMLPQN